MSVESLEHKYASMRIRIHDLSDDVHKALTVSETQKVEIANMKQAVTDLKDTMATKEQMNNLGEKINEVRNAVIAVFGAIILAVLGAIMAGVLK